MATVGHALIGLAGAALVPETASRNPRRAAYLWPGVMVLLACALDLVEWVEVWWNPLTSETPLADRHLGWVLAISAALGVATAWGMRARGPWPVLLLVAVTASHVLLDMAATRKLIAGLAGVRQLNEESSEFALRVILTEVRIYGWVTVVTALAAAARAIPTRRTRRVAVVLAVACTAAAGVGSAWAWAPVYLAASVYSLGALHALFRPVAVLNLLLIAPVGVMAVAHAEGARRLQVATEAFRNRDQPTAVRGFEAALALRTRRGREAAYGRMGEAYEIMGDFAQAETNYRKAVAVAAHPGWYDLMLARLYRRADAWGTPRTEEARESWLRLRDCPESSPGLRDRAADDLRKLEAATTGG